MDGGAGEDEFGGEGVEAVVGEGLGDEFIGKFFEVTAFANDDDAGAAEVEGGGFEPGDALDGEGGFSAGVGDEGFDPGFGTEGGADFAAGLTEDGELVAISTGFVPHFGEVQGDGVADLGRFQDDAAAGDEGREGGEDGREEGEGGPGDGPDDAVGFPPEVAEPAEAVGIIEEFCVAGGFFAVEGELIDGPEGFFDFGAGIDEGFAAFHSDGFREGLEAALNEFREASQDFAGVWRFWFGPGGLVQRLKGSVELVAG